METWVNYYEANAGFTVCVTFISLACAHICIKTIVWWTYYSIIGLFKNWFTSQMWKRKTAWGMLGIIALILGNVLLWATFDLESDVYYWVVVILSLFAARMAWREFFTLCGLFRGDWSFSCPELRFFAWNKFNPLFFMKVFSSPFSRSGSSDDDWKEDVRREEYYHYQQRGLYV